MSYTPEFVVILNNVLYAVKSLSRACRENLGEPRETACPEQTKRADGSHSLRRNNRVFGSLSYHCL